MTFKTYDILSSLVPGFIITLVILRIKDIPFDKDYTVAYTAIAFLMGYLANTIGSWLEDIFYFIWGGKPSSNLLEGKSIWKVKIFNATTIKTHLALKTSNTNPSNDELFSIAKKHTNGQKDTRIDDFNALYAFSRTLLTTGIICGAIILSEHWKDWRYYSVVLPMVFVLWLRCKQRGYYYALEVLNVYSKSNNI
jgi:hypothetical protein